MSSVLRGDGYGIIHGDSGEVLKKLRPESVDAVVTDPPAGISFMARGWDRDKGGRDKWIDWLEGIMREALRVTKPGGWALVWALPRTSHWTATAIEDAGWEIRDRIHDLASHDEKLIRFVACLAPRQRDVFERLLEGQASPILSHLRGTGMPKGFLKGEGVEGLGTGLKPVVEHWILARKPFVGSVNKNLAQHGTGALQIDACRVKAAGGSPSVKRRATAKRTGNNPGKPGAKGFVNRTTPERYQAERAGEQIGRYPPHVILTHAPGCRLVGTKRVKTGKAHRTKSGGKSFGGTFTKRSMPDMTYADQDGKESMPAFECVEGCPVREVDSQSGIAKPKRERRAKKGGSPIHQGGMKPDHVGTWPGDSGGGVSRFWPTFRYQAGASKKEKNAGCDDLDPRDYRDGTKTCTPYSNQLLEHVGRKGKPRANNHATVKSVDLMRWLVRLVTPKGGLVLDPFNGSGTTGVAAILEGMRYLGIEGGDKDSPYFCEVSRRRIEAALEERDG